MSLSTIETTVVPSAPERRTVPAVAFWTIFVLGAVAGGYYVEQALATPAMFTHLMDLSVYQIAGHRVADGVSIYDTPLLGHTRGVWEFVYTPFAALLFVPLIDLHGEPYTWVGMLGNFAMLTASAWAALSMLGYRRDRRLVLLGLPIAGLLLWCEPVRETMAFGQINIFLLLLVLADMALPDSSRWKGVLTGIAAGIKLTPAFFVIYLLVTRRYRAAATATGAFAATVLIGLAAMPKDSLTFWSGAFADPTRVGVPENPSNESLRGMLARTVGVAGNHQLLWLAGAFAIAAICLCLARRLSLTGHELPAVVLCGLTTTAVSPYSWVHHWVWLAPLLIYLADLAFRRRGIAAPLGLLLALAVASGGVFALLGSAFSSTINYPSDKTFGLLIHNAYIWLTLALFTTAAIQSRRLRTQAVEPSRMR
ncbi:glycosyltransferase 87 family protein [Nocardia sp. NBC_00565]|uniref:glycosyltransferase 87 family protein n=1 Tax=Nocardia sp. NBC_00565 TaxID=2975993 RepID=UPI002E8090A4|nr:glycosyltransferase 87 family protein [Nocardia sp. NBC_00565]WUC00462.1 glycosyltransferase 87 family protein [Nocardia sp. NBC_00565]